MKLLLTIALLLAIPAYAQVADNYIIVVDANTVSSDGNLQWHCDKNGTTVMASRTNTFEVGTSNTALDNFLAEQLQKCRDDNAGTITEQRQSHSKPPMHGSTEHDSTVPGGSPTDDNVNIGNGSIWQPKALPSCSNATTSKLLYDISTNSFSCGTDQSAGAQWIPQCVDTTVTSVSATTTETTVFTCGIAAGDLNAVGRTLKIKLNGTLTTSASAPNVTFRIKAGSTVLCGGIAVGPAANKSNDGLYLECDITTVSTGVGGTVEAQGMWNSVSNTGSRATLATMPNTAVVAVDLTAGITLTATYQWSLNTAANTFTQRLAQAYISKF